MKKSVIISQQVLRFTFVKLKASGPILVGEIEKRKDELNFNPLVVVNI
jgi:hypothetical protein